MAWRLVDFEAEEVETILNQKGSDSIPTQYKTDKKVFLHVHTFCMCSQFCSPSQIYKRDVDHPHESINLYPPKVIVEIDHSLDTHNIGWEVCLSGTENKCCLTLCSPRQLSPLTKGE